MNSSAHEERRAAAVSKRPRYPKDLLSAKCHAGSKSWQEHSCVAEHHGNRN